MTDTSTAVLDRDDAAPSGNDPSPQERPTRHDPAAGETVLVRQVRYFTAICSFAAAIIHVLAMAAHVDHHPTLGRAFLMTAVFQVLWGVLLIVEPRKVFVALGAVMTALVIATWAFSRTKGISWFPDLENVETLEWRDVVEQFFQLLAVAGALVILLPAHVHQPAGDRVELAPIAAMTVLSMLTLGVLYAATHDYQHVEVGGSGHVHEPGMEMPTETGG